MLRRKLTDDPVEAVASALARKEGFARLFVIHRPNTIRGAGRVVTSAYTSV